MNTCRSDKNLEKCPAVQLAKKGYQFFVHFIIEVLPKSRISELL